MYSSIINTYNMKTTVQPQNISFTIEEQINAILKHVERKDDLKRVTEIHITDGCVFADIEPMDIKEFIRIYGDGKLYTTIHAIVG